MNLGQFFSAAGQANVGIRQAEEAERVARQNQLAIEEQNRVADLKRQLAGLQMPSFQPVDVAQFTQQFTPGQTMPFPAAPAAPVPGQMPLPAGVQPSQAGAGRGVVNPPLVGQPQPPIGAGAGRGLVNPPLIGEPQPQPPSQPYQDLSGFTTPAGMTGPQNLAALRDARMQRFAATAAPAVVPRAGPAVAAGATRSDRNNNPGNLIYNQYTVGLGATGKDKDGFAVFPSTEVGQAASLANLQNYGQQGINTVEGIISKWSPPKGKGNTPQGTQNYINFVAQQLGVDPKQPLNMGDTATLQALNAAIRQFEGTGTPSAAAPGAAPAAAAAPTAAAPSGPPTPLEVPHTQARNMDMAEFYLANPESIPMELQQINQMAQQQAAFLTRQRNETAQLAQVYMRSGTQQGIDAAMRLRENIGQLDASLLQIQQQVGQKQVYLQGMQGLRELAAANDPRRLAGVLTQYMGTPVGIQPRPDGKYNYFINGKKVQDGVSPAQLAAMALKEFSPEARQASAASAALENELALKRKYGDAMVNAMRDIQKAMIEGEYKIAEERAKQLQGKLTIDTSKGVAYFQQGNRVFVITPDGKVEETPLGKIELPPTARAVAGLNMGS